MNAVKIVYAATMLAVTMGVSGHAQAQNDTMKKDGMMSEDSKMKMSAADKKMMAKCKGMSHAMMMKNKGCMKMMKMHPDMMQGG